MFVPKSCIYFTLLPLSLIASNAFAEQLSTSTEVQANKNLLIETNNCPQCNLSGANLIRLDLSGANLEGANLSRAKMSLVNLSGANLRNADLREAVLNGADLADVNLSGADLTRTALVGAYMSGAIMDGEIVVTEPYMKEGISDIQEYVYVDDTVKPKDPHGSAEMTIGDRRDFEETPPAMKIETLEMEPVKGGAPQVDAGDVVNKSNENFLPIVSVEVPESKTAPIIQEVLIKKEVEEQFKPAEEVKNEEFNKDTVAETDPVEEDMLIEKVFAEDKQSSAKSSGVIAPVEMPQEINETLQGKNDTENGEGIIESMFSMFSNQEPSTIILKNVALLLDLNKCYGCNLSGVTLSGENLDGADLEGADFSGAILKDVDFESANLKGTNFTGADLTGADLSESDLYKADFTGANLTDVNFEKALLDDVNFTGVKGYFNQALMLSE